MDATSISLAVSIGAQFLSSVKNLSSSLIQLGKSELAGDLLDLQQKAMELVQKHQLLIDENRDLSIQIQELKNLLEIKSKLEVHYDAYWTRNSDGILDGPFSFHYWDHEQKLVRMHNYGQDHDISDCIMFSCQIKNDNIENSFVPIEWAKKNNLAAANEIGS